MSRLRMDSHRLYKETGRWTSTDLTDRTCSYCNTLENEFYFLFECNLYNNLRAKCIPNYYTSNPNMVKTIEKVVTDDPTAIRNIANYIYKSVEFRENFVNS